VGNASLNWASIVGIVLAVCGGGLYFLRSFKPALARDYDVFFAAIGLLCGGILFFQGWRLDPILQFGQFLLAGTTVFFAYESAKYAENKINALQRKDSKFDVHMPDIYLVKSEKIIVYDNFNNSIQAVYNANPQKTSYEDALEIIEEIQNSIDHSGELEETSYSNTTGQLEFKSNFTKNEYMSSVNKIKEYIKRN